jgi:hypothetical protein
VASSVRNAPRPQRPSYSPLHRVTAVFGSSDGLPAALLALRAAGFPDGEVAALAGDADAVCGRAFEAGREPVVRLLGDLEVAFGWGEELDRHLGRVLRAGGAVVGVLAVGEDEKGRAARALHASDADAVYYRGCWSTERL